MEKGLKGLNVMIGKILMIVWILSEIGGDLKKKKNLGFEDEEWYWKLVEVVWMLILLEIYVWGGWGEKMNGGW